MLPFTLYQTQVIFYHCYNAQKVTAFFKTAKRTVELSKSNDGCTFGKVEVCTLKQSGMQGVCINAVCNG